MLLVLDRTVSMSVMFVVLLCFFFVILELIRRFCFLLDFSFFLKVCIFSFLLLFLAVGWVIFFGSCGGRV